MKIKDVDIHETYRYTGPCTVIGIRNNLIHLQTEEYSDFWVDAENVEVYEKSNVYEPFIPSKEFEEVLQRAKPLPNIEFVGKNDKVNHPAHYIQGGIECIEALKAATVNKTGIEAVCVANAIKYLWRYENKNGIEDVQKAKWYIERLIKELEEKNDERK